MSLHRLFVVAFVAALGAMVLPACGGDDDDGDDQLAGSDSDGDDDVASCPVCDEHASCSDAAVGCVCNSGFTGTPCVDIDECATNNGGCDAQTVCTNTPGGRTCGACPVGTVGSGETSCETLPRIVLFTAGLENETSLEATLTGVNFEQAAQVYLGDTLLTSTYVDNATLNIVVPLPAPAAELAITVRNSDTAVSNSLWFAYGASFNVADIDALVTGGTAVVHGLGYVDGSMSIEDSAGHLVTGGTVSSGPWGDNTMSAFPFAVGSDFQSGPMTVHRGEDEFVSRPMLVVTNLALSATAAASTEYDVVYAASTVNDGTLQTGWFALDNDCATDPVCTSVPWVELAWETPQTVHGVSVRGNRAYGEGYDILVGRIDVYSGDAIIATQTIAFDRPYGDGDYVASAALSNVTKVRLTSVVDESIEPGIAELIVY